MEDKDILQLYIEHDEEAIRETDIKYRRYLMKIAMNILANNDDAEECLNDVYMSVWKSVSYTKPYDLKIYLARATKNKALKLIESKTAEKRGGGQYNLVLDELADVVSTKANPETELLRKVTKKQIEDFLYGIPELDRYIFIRRYWYFEKSSDIAKKYEISNANVKIRLHRIRARLKEYLENEE